MKKEIYLIELDGERYQVKNENGERMILLNGTWTKYYNFICWLADNELWLQLCALAELGMYKVKIIKQ